MEFCRRSLLVLLTIFHLVHYSTTDFHNFDGKTIKRLKRRIDELIRSNGYKSDGVVSLHVSDDRFDRSKCWRLVNHNQSKRCGHRKELVPSGVSDFFVALGILDLQKHGHLALDDRVFGAGAILGPNTCREDERIEDVTVEHLLRHVSGIEEFETDPRHGFYNSIRLATSPGAHYRKCRRCYEILCKIVQIFTGSECETYVRKKILVPMGFPKIVHRGRWYARPHDLLSFFHKVSTDSAEFSSVLRSKPGLPYPQHKSNWPGIGLRVANDGYLWSDSYLLKNDSLLLHSVNGPRNVTLFLSLSENRRKRLKPIINSVINDILSV